MFTRQLFNLRKGDLDGDGNDEILLGIIKKTRLDKVVRKRLFIFYVDSLTIRPKFLSSKIFHELIDFGVYRNQHRNILTIEKIKKNDFRIGRYEVLEFGLLFKEYTGKYNALSNCQKEFNHEIY